MDNKKCDLFLAAEKVAEDIPEGFYISLNLEKDAGYIELYQHGEKINIGLCPDGTLAEQMLEALEEAKKINKFRNKNIGIDDNGKIQAD